MTTSEIMNLVNALERRYPVQRWKIDGICIWPVVRIRLFLDLYDFYREQKVTKQLNGISSLLRFAWCSFMGVVKYFCAFLVDFRNNHRPSPGDEVFLYSDGISFSKIKGRWYERFLDPVAEFLRKGEVPYAVMSPLHTYYTPRFTPSMFVQPILEFRRLMGRVFEKLSKVHDEQLEGFAEFSQDLAARKLPIQVPTLTQVRGMIVSIRAVASFFDRILESVRPRAVFLVSYYGLDGMALNLACRNAGIPSVDIQHGLQGDSHVAYGRWTNVPKEGYELLPSIFWCWSQDEAQSILDWSHDVKLWHRPVVGGNLWLRQWRRGTSCFVKDFDDCLTKEKKASHRTVHVLVTLQYGVSDIQRLIPVLKAAEKLKPEWFWWVRAHPSRLGEKEEVKKLLQSEYISGVLVDQATEYPLYSILRHVDIHLTQCSSTVIEAECFGVPSVVTTEDGRELFARQIASGWARYAEKTEDILTTLQYQLERKPSLQKEQLSFSEEETNPEELIYKIIGKLA